VGATALFSICDANKTYRRELEAKFSKDDWCNLLSISHRYECEGARKRSIKGINNLGSSVTSAEKIAMALTFGVEGWMVPACVALVEREGTLTLAEAYDLGLEMTVLVGKAREKYIRLQRQGAGNAYSFYNSSGQLFPQRMPTTTELVKDVLRIK